MLLSNVGMYLGEVLDASQKFLDDAEGKAVSIQEMFFAEDRVNNIPPIVSIITTLPGEQGRGYYLAGLEVQMHHAAVSEEEARIIRMNPTDEIEHAILERQKLDLAKKKARIEDIQRKITFLATQFPYQPPLSEDEH